MEVRSRTCLAACSSRGVSYWTDGHREPHLRWLSQLSLRARCGHGQSDSRASERTEASILRKGLREPYQEQSVALTTPGSIYKDLIIVGGSNPETHPAPPGDIRAFDVRTGAVRWTFHTIPHPGEFGYDTWPKDAWKDAGAANNWAGMTRRYQARHRLCADRFRGLRLLWRRSHWQRSVCRYAACARCRDRQAHLAFPGRAPRSLGPRFSRASSAADGHARRQAGRRHSADDQVGLCLYLFDRTTGKPLFPIKESPYPASNVPGEVTSPTQPLPTAPAPYTQQSTTEDTLTNRTPEAHAWAVKQFKTMIGGGQFIPPSVDKLTIDMPGFAGGGEWGGTAVDPDHGVLYVNANDTAWLVGLTVPPPPGKFGRARLPEPVQRLPRHQPGRLPARDSCLARASRASSPIRRSQTPSARERAACLPSTA